VAPGFDYADFALMADHEEKAAKLRARFPEFAELL
jgi:hypothetical protein